MLVDSHCHLDRLDLSAYGGDIAPIFQAAKAAGVVRMLCVAVDLASHDARMHLVEKYANIDLSVGVHPLDVQAAPFSLNDLLRQAEHPRVVAIGETGLDYYRVAESDAIVQQQQGFRTHIRAACQLNKPLIVHTRQAKADTLRILAEEQADQVGGVMHCFTEDWEMAQRAMELGFFISFSGIVTFKNAQRVQSVARKVPLDRILIETDAPYLAPVPHRGGSNQPAYVRYVAEFISKLRGIELEVLAEATTENYRRLFRVTLD